MSKNTDKAPATRQGKASRTVAQSATSGTIKTAPADLGSSAAPNRGITQDHLNIRLKKAGGSLIVTMPASARDQLHLTAEHEMSVAVEGGRLVLEPAARRPKYTLDELLAQSDFEAPYSAEEREWIDAPPVGREIL